MRIIEINDINKLINIEVSCACIGFFDGVHLGHQELIKKTFEVASVNNVKKTVITFNILLNENSFKNNHYLFSFNQKISILQEYNFDYILVINFNEEFKKHSYEVFDTFLENYNIKYLVCGFDFKYGYKALGNIETLKNKYQNNLFVIPKYSLNNQKVSSTLIKQLLQEGNIKQANYLLSRTYFIEGKIVKGYQNGRKIGFPTANVDAVCNIKSGVYVGYVIYDEIKYKALINYGNNPTVNGEYNTLEVHIIDFNKNIYGEIIKVYFVDYLRTDVKFNSLDELKNQINIDKQKVMSYE